MHSPGGTPPLGAVRSSVEPPFRNPLSLPWHPDICQLPAEMGLCDADLPRFFYNTRSGACDQFIYGGCAGNPNNFEAEAGRVPHPNSLSAQ
uniref:BPTI/Kunitz inhibitor domain-containing protein n=1 Tax=Pelusios castaneus TaxID=367368 RepID=A0A8C8S4C9_9SAUR